MNRESRLFQHLYKLTVVYIFLPLLSDSLRHHLSIPMYRSVIQTEMYIHYIIVATAKKTYIPRAHIYFSHRRG